MEEARTLVAAGARSLVDWTPIGLGRDLDGVVRVSEETGLHVVAATGLESSGASCPSASSSPTPRARFAFVPRTA